MWILRHLAGRGAKPPTGSVIYRGLLTQWQRVRWQGAPGVSHAAHIPDDHPEAAAIRAQALRQGSTSVVADHEILPLGERPPDPLVAQSPPPRGVPNGVVGAPFSEDDRASIAEAAQVSPTDAKVFELLHLCAIARANGWGFQDFRGAGIGGDPTERGGRGQRSGLTLAELTLTRPPQDWEKLFDQGKPPWMSADWHPPDPTWRPPSWPGTGRDLEERSLDPDRDPDLQPGTITDRAAYEAAKARGEIAEIPPGDPRASAPPAAQIAERIVTEAREIAERPENRAAVKEAVERIVSDFDLKPGEADGEETDGVEDPLAPLATYPAEALEQAREITRDLARRQKKVPHPNSVNHFLHEREGLPKVNTAQIAALLVGFDYNP